MSFWLRLFIEDILPLLGLLLVLEFSWFLNGDLFPVVTALLVYIFFIHIKLYRHELLLSSSARSVHMKKLQLGIPYQIGKVVLIFAVLGIGYQILDFFQKNNIQAVKAKNVQGESKVNGSRSDTPVPIPRPVHPSNIKKKVSESETGKMNTTSKAQPNKPKKTNNLKTTKDDDSKKTFVPPKKAQPDRSVLLKDDSVKETKKSPMEIKKVVPKEKTPNSEKDGLKPFKEKW